MFKATTKEYKIVHKKELIGWFYVEANSPEEALEIYHQQVNNGEIDFGDMTLVNIENYVDLNEDEKIRDNTENVEYEFSDLHLEFLELDLSIYPMSVCSCSPEEREMGPYLNKIKVDKSIFDDYHENAVIQISFVDLPHPDLVYDYLMVDEDDDWIWMEQI